MIKELLCPDSPAHLVCERHSGTEYQIQQRRIPQPPERIFIQQAGLSNDEAQKFFPLYFELQDKKQAYNKEAWQKLRQGKNPNTTETEYGKIVEDVIQARIAADELELEYVRKYKQFLPAKKIYLLQKRKCASTENC